MPDFLLFSLERGVVRLAKQLLGLLLEVRDSSAEMLGSLLSFLIFLTVSREAGHPEMAGLGSFLTPSLTRLQERLQEEETGWRWRRTVLARLLEGSTVDGAEMTQLELDQDLSASEDGYEADMSDDDTIEREVKKLPGKVGHVFYASGLRFYCRGLVCLLQQLATRRVQGSLYSLEYLLYRLAALCSRDAESLLLVAREFLHPFLQALFLAAEAAPEPELAPLSAIVEQLLSLAAGVFLCPDSLRTVFKFLARPNSLRPRLLPSLCSMLTCQAGHISLPSFPLTSASRRPRLSSNLSSDSGLEDSTCSQHSALGPVLALPNSRVQTIREAEMDRNLAVVLR